jgi:methionyl-tRNA formyltransferase
MKKILVFAQANSKYSRRILKYLSTQNKLKVSIIIFSQDSIIKNIKKCLSFYEIKPNIFLDSKPHKNVKIGNLVKKNKINLAISTSYIHIIDNKFLKLFSEGVINLHPSALPFNRGCHHAFWGIMDGTHHGCTMHYMDNKIDSGKIIDQIKFKNYQEITAEEVIRRSHNLMLVILKKNLKLIANNKLKKKKQKKGSYHSRKMIIKKSTLNINEKISVDFLWRLLRATKIKNHGYFIKINNKKFKIISKIIKTNS